MNKIEIINTDINEEQKVCENDKEINSKNGSNKKKKNSKMIELNENDESGDEGINLFEDKNIKNDILDDFQTPPMKNKMIKINTSYNNINTSCTNKNK